MGMFRDSGSEEIDIVKEMAEGLGSQGFRLEEILEKASVAPRTGAENGAMSREPRRRLRGIRHFGHQ